MNALRAPTGAAPSDAVSARRALARAYVGLAQAQMDGIAVLTDNDAEPSDVEAADLLAAALELLTRRAAA